jgi:DNA polymerase III subunit epsilon
MTGKQKNRLHSKLLKFLRCVYITSVFIMYFVFDLETSGLPKKTTSKLFGPIYKDLDKYDTARIVSISWIVLDATLNNVCCEYHVVKPEGFEVPEASSRIHGITHQYALANGITLDDVFSKIAFTMRKHQCNTVVSHNIFFDRNVLLSELYRNSKYNGLFYNIMKMDLFCTMQRGKTLMKNNKNPKLKELYEFLFNMELKNAHNALHDTMNCAECFKAIIHSEAKSKTDVESLNSIPTPSDRIDSSSSNVSVHVVPQVSACAPSNLVPAVTFA